MSTPTHQEPIKLEPIKARERAVSDGPWKITDQYPMMVGTTSVGLYLGRRYELPEADLDFIAHSREDIPALIAEVERLRAHLAEVEAMSVSPSEQEKGLQIERLKQENSGLRKRYWAVVAASSEPVRLTTHLLDTFSLDCSVSEVYDCDTASYQLAAFIGKERADWNQRARQTQEAASRAVSVSPSDERRNTMLRLEARSFANTLDECAQTFDHPATRRPDMVTLLRKAASWIRLLNGSQEAASRAVSPAQPKSLRDTGEHGSNVVTSLILANLTDDDFDRFHAAKIGYSGSTGKGAVKGYKPVGPYIATYLCELPAVLHALGWQHAEVSMPTAPHGSATLRHIHKASASRAVSGEPTKDKSEDI